MIKHKHEHFPALKKHDFLPVKKVRLHFLIITKYFNKTLSDPQQVINKLLENMNNTNGKHSYLVCTFHLLLHLVEI